MLNSLTVIFYSFAAALQYGAMKRPITNAKPIIWLLSLFAILFHAVSLYHWIDVGAGQNLTALNMVSLVAWLGAVIVVIMSFVDNLGLFVFPFAAISVVLAVAIPGHHVVDTAADLRQLFHILLSVFSFGVFGLATLQSLVLATQERRLRGKQTGGIWEKLPAIETMEIILFQLILVGFLSLTVLLISSFYFYHHMLWQGFLLKSVLACITWSVFAVLLFAHKYLGWRGKKAVIGVQIGIGLLLLTIGFKL